jgi:acyl-CoA synthetase (AMP-forming)/AMP-acid ligase II
VAALRTQCKRLPTLIYAGDGQAPAGAEHLERIIERAQPIADADCAGDDLAGIFYTGGTTGYPKGVMLSHANLLWCALSGAAAQVTDRDDVLVYAPPRCFGCSAAVMSSSRPTAPGLSTGDTMNHFNKLLVTTFLSAATLFTSAAQAMDINDYFKMADQDQGRFDQTLLTGAEKVLNDEGRADLANQLDALFTEVKPGNKLSDGMADYLARLGAMLGAEVEREVRNPNLPHLQAERAFRDAAKYHGIILPSAFDTVASDFHPQFPPKQLGSQ